MAARATWVDEIAVERAVQWGEADVPAVLRTADRREAVRRLVQAGWSSARIARRLRVTVRTIDRDCAALGLDRGGPAHAPCTGGGRAA